MASGVRELPQAAELVLCPGVALMAAGWPVSTMCNPDRRSLTYIRRHPDAALHRGLLAWHEPVAVVNPEHTLQQLHKDGLAV